LYAGLDSCGEQQTCGGRLDECAASDIEPCIELPESEAGHTERGAAFLARVLTVAAQRAFGKNGVPRIAVDCTHVALRHAQFAVDAGIAHLPLENAEPREQGQKGARGADVPAPEALPKVICPDDDREEHGRRDAGVEIDPAEIKLCKDVEAHVDKQGPKQIRGPGQEPQERRKQDVREHARRNGQGAEKGKEIGAEQRGRDHADKHEILDAPVGLGVYGFFLMLLAEKREIRKVNERAERAHVAAKEPADHKRQDKKDACPEHGGDKRARADHGDYGHQRIEPQECIEREFRRIRVLSEQEDDDEQEEGCRLGNAAES